MPVHPSTCGEHCALVTLSRSINGSSQHLRGTHLPDQEEAIQLRFIPAPAGNTLIKNSLVGSPAVHPSTCGEHVLVFVCPFGEGGSSQHLRGTL